MLQKTLLKCSRKPIKFSSQYSDISSLRYQPGKQFETVLNEVFLAQKPVRVRGLASGWPAIADPTREWSLRNLKNRMGDRLISVEALGNYMNPKMKFINIEFSQFVDYISSGKSDHYYLAQTPMSDFPELEEDIDIPSICNSGKGHMYRLYLQVVIIVVTEK